MDKRAVQAIGVAVATGMLFLQAMVAGGVASEEMGMVMDSMRSLRRSSSIYYELTSFTKGEETVQKIWVDLLTEQWVEELSAWDDDGMVVSWKRYFDGKNEWLNDGQSGWDMTDSEGEVPGYTTVTNFPFGVDDIEETETEETEDGVKLTFTATEELLEKRKEELAELLEAENGGSMREISYQQYADTRFENVTVTYEIDAEGELREVQFTMEVTQPQLLLNSGKYELGEEETYQIGYRAEIIKVNDKQLETKVGECASEVGGSFYSN